MLLNWIKYIIIDLLIFEKVEKVPVNYYNYSLDLYIYTIFIYVRIYKSDIYCVVAEFKKKIAT